MAIKKSGLPENLDPETKKFIAWTFEKLEDDRSLVKTVDEVTSEARNWLLKHKKQLRKLLKAKMIKGGLEHGPPRHSLKRLEEELVGERLDLIGWSMVKKWNQKRLSKSKK